MNRKWALGIGIPIAILGLLALGTYAWIRAPVDTESYEDPVSADTAEQNTALAAALRAGGLDDPFVDVTAAQAYVGYEVPDDAAGSAGPTDWQWFVLGAAADTVTTSDRVIAVQYEGDNAVLSWTVPLDALDAFAAGDMERDELEAQIDKRTF